MLAYSYQRFSSAKQKKGDSARRQAAARDEWLNRHPDAILDTKLKMNDDGVSGWSGKNLEDTACLGAFMKLAEAGRIPKGAYLLVENLDRLSRRFHDGMELLLGITRLGITVVQLVPQCIEFKYPCEPMTIMMAVMELSRGNSESEIKSERLGKLWVKKREKMSGETQDAKISVTQRLPGWLSWKDGKPVLNEHAITIKELFKLILEGTGFGTIAKIFNQRKYKTFGRVKVWASSTLHSIAMSKAPMGVHQPRTEHKTAGKRINAGAEIEGYFPAVVTSKEWYSAQDCIRGRSGNRAGRKPNRGRNLFAGILRDPVSGTNFQMNCGTGANLVQPYATKAQFVEGDASASFPVEVLELALLSKLANLNINELLPDQPVNEIGALSQELAEIDSRLTEIEEAILNGTALKMDRQIAQKLEARKELLLTELDRAKMKASHPTSEALGEMSGLIEAMKKQPLDETRNRLASTIRRIVKDVWAVVRKDGNKRIVIAQIVFHDGLPDQIVIINYVKAGQGRGWVRPMSWEALDWRGGSNLRLWERETALKFFHAGENSEIEDA